MSRFLLALALLVTTLPATAQDADPSDVESIGAILDAVYDVISGPTTEARDWDRFRSLMHEDARLIPIGQGQDSTWGPYVVWSVEDYVAYGSDAFANSPVLQGKGFYEVEATRRVERYSHLAHAWSTYETRLDPSEEPFARGINSFQLYHDGERWWVMQIFWQQESPDAPIPVAYLPEGQ
ncbi:MAG: hypothetical protein AAGI52_04290 [Bacteroidota bacterium]